MQDSKTYRSKAIRTAARALLQKQNAMKENDNVIDAIKQAINLGGGQSFLEEIGPYWFFEYKPGIKIAIWRKNEGVKETESIEEWIETEENTIIIEDISRKEFMSYARKIWNEEKQGQMKLF